MNLEKLLAILVVLVLAGACSVDDDSPDEIACIYVPHVTEVPNPAFWAITEAPHPRLIDPSSELSDVITEKLGSIDTHVDLRVGDILVATRSSFLIDPESLGIDREVIMNCQGAGTPV